MLRYSVDKVLTRLSILCAFAAVLVAAQIKPDASKGNETFDEQCSSCHYTDSFERKVGPGLKWFYSQKALQSSGKPLTDANVVEKINSGGKGMPAFKDSLTDSDRANLIAYLKTL